MAVMKHTFSQYHPGINFTFYIGAFLFGMLFYHPAFLACSMFFAFACYLTMEGKTFKFPISMLVLFLLLSVINPLFNPSGSRILFTYANGRTYTLEALCYGMAVAAMFVTVLTWFASYQMIMTSDKFLYCFGRLLPSVSMTLTMVLRFIPAYKKQLKKIADARKCVGKSIESGDLLKRAECGMTLVSTLTSWALEGGMITAESMQSRGYGSGSRTSFSVYRWESRDKVLLFTMLADILVIVYCMIKGGTFAEYLPQIQMSGANNPYTIIGLAGYALFLAIPAAVSVTEEIKWFILKSKM